MESRRSSTREPRGGRLSQDRSGICGGFPIGSGAVEKASRHALADRFDGGGMCWKLETADPVMQLRAASITRSRLNVRRFVATNPPRKEATAA